MKKVISGKQVAIHDIGSAETKPSTTHGSEENSNKNEETREIHFSKELLEFLLENPVCGRSDYTDLPGAKQDVRSPWRSFQYYPRRLSLPRSTNSQVSLLSAATLEERRHRSDMARLKRKQRQEEQLWKKRELAAKRHAACRERKRLALLEKVSLDNMDQDDSSEGGQESKVVIISSPQKTLPHKHSSVRKPTQLKSGEAARSRKNLFSVINAMSKEGSEISTNQASCASSSVISDLETLIDNVASLDYVPPSELNFDEEDEWVVKKLSLLGDGVKAIKAKSSRPRKEQMQPSNDLDASVSSSSSTDGKPSPILTTLVKSSKVWSSQGLSDVEEETWTVMSSTHHPSPIKAVADSSTERRMRRRKKRVNYIEWEEYDDLVDSENVHKADSDTEDAHQACENSSKKSEKNDREKEPNAKNQYNNKSINDESHSKGDNVSSSETLAKLLQKEPQKRPSNEVGCSDREPSQGVVSTSYEEKESHFLDKGTVNRVSNSHSSASINPFPTFSVNLSQSNFPVVSSAQSIAIATPAMVDQLSLGSNYSPKTAQPISTKAADPQPHPSHSVYQNVPPNFLHTFPHDSTGDSNYAMPLSSQRNVSKPYDNANVLSSNGNQNWKFPSNNNPANNMATNIFPAAVGMIEVSNPLYSQGVINTPSPLQSPGSVLNLSLQGLPNAGTTLLPHTALLPGMSNPTNSLGVQPGPPPLFCPPGPVLINPRIGGPPPKSNSSLVVNQEVNSLSFKTTTTSSAAQFASPSLFYVNLDPLKQTVRLPAANQASFSLPDISNGFMQSRNDPRPVLGVPVNIIPNPQVYSQEKNAMIKSSTLGESNERTAQKMQSGANMPLQKSVQSVTARMPFPHNNQRDKGAQRAAAPGQRTNQASFKMKQQILRPPNTMEHGEISKQSVKQKQIPAKGFTPPLPLDNRSRESPVVTSPMERNDSVSPGKRKLENTAMASFQGNSEADRFSKPSIPFKEPLWTPPPGLSDQPLQKVPKMTKLSKEKSLKEIDEMLNSISSLPAKKPGEKKQDASNSNSVNQKEMTSFSDKPSKQLATSSALPDPSYDLPGVTTATDLSRGTHKSNVSSQNYSTTTSNASQHAENVVRLPPPLIRPDMFPRPPPAHVQRPLLSKIPVAPETAHNKVLPITKNSLVPPSNPLYPSHLPAANIQMPYMPPLSFMEPGQLNPALSPMSPQQGHSRHALPQSGLIAQTLTRPSPSQPPFVPPSSQRGKSHPRAFSAKSYPHLSAARMRGHGNHPRLRGKTSRPNSTTRARLAPEQPASLSSLPPDAYVSQHIQKQMQVLERERDSSRSVMQSRPLSQERSVYPEENPVEDIRVYSQFNLRPSMPGTGFGVNNSFVSAQRGPRPRGPPPLLPVTQKSMNIPIVVSRPSYGNARTTTVKRTGAETVTSSSLVPSVSPSQRQEGVERKGFQTSQEITSERGEMSEVSKNPEKEKHMKTVTKEALSSSPQSSPTSSSPSLVHNETVIEGKPQICNTSSNVNNISINIAPSQCSANSVRSLKSMTLPALQTPTNESLYSVSSSSSSSILSAPATSQWVKTIISSAPPVSSFLYDYGQGNMTSDTAERATTTSSALITASQMKCSMSSTFLGTKSSSSSSSSSITTAKEQKPNIRDLAASLHSNNYNNGEESEEEGYHEEEDSEPEEEMMDIKPVINQNISSVVGVKHPSGMRVAKHDCKSTGPDVHTSSSEALERCEPLRNAVEVTSSVAGNLRSSTSSDSSTITSELSTQQIMRASHTLHVDQMSLTDRSHVSKSNSSCSSAGFQRSPTRFSRPSGAQHFVSPPRNSVVASKVASILSRIKTELNGAMSSAILPTASPIVSPTESFSSSLPSPIASVSQALITASVSQIPVTGTLNVNTSTQNARNTEKQTDDTNLSSSLCSATESSEATVTEKQASQSTVSPSFHDHIINEVAQPSFSPAITDIARMNHLEEMVLSVVVEAPSSFNMQVTSDCGITESTSIPPISNIKGNSILCKPKASGASCSVMSSPSSDLVVSENVHVSAQLSFDTVVSPANTNCKVVPLVTASEPHIMEFVKENDGNSQNSEWTGESADSLFAQSKMSETLKSSCAPSSIGVSCSYRVETQTFSESIVTTAAKSQDETTYSYGSCESVVSSEMSQISTAPIMSVTIPCSECQDTVTSMTTIQSHSSNDIVVSSPISHESFPLISSAATVDSSATSPAPKTSHCNVKEMAIDDCQKTQGPFGQSPLRSSGAQTLTILPLTLSTINSPSTEASRLESTKVTMSSIIPVSISPSVCQNSGEVVDSVTEASVFEPLVSNYSVHVTQTPPLPASADTRISSPPPSLSSSQNNQVVLGLGQSDLICDLIRVKKELSEEFDEVPESGLLHSGIILSGDKCPPRGRIVIEDSEEVSPVTSALCIKENCFSAKWPVLVDAPESTVPLMANDLTNETENQLKSDASTVSLVDFNGTYTTCSNYSPSLNNNSVLSQSEKLETFEVPGSNQDNINQARNRLSMAVVIPPPKPSSVQAIFSKSIANLSRVGPFYSRPSDEDELTAWQVKSSDGNINKGDINDIFANVPFTSTSSSTSAETAEQYTVVVGLQNSDSAEDKKDNVKMELVKVENNVTSDHSDPVEFSGVNSVSMMSVGKTEKLTPLPLTVNIVSSNETSLAVNKEDIYPSDMITQAKEPESLKLCQSEVVDATQTEPLILYQSEAIDATQTEHVIVYESEAIDCTQIEPSKLYQLEAIDASRTEPLKRCQSQDVDVSQMEPLKRCQSQDVDVSQKEPLKRCQSRDVDASQTELLKSCLSEDKNSTQVEPPKSCQSEDIDNLQGESLNLCQAETLSATEMEPLNLTQMQVVDATESEPHISCQSVHVETTQTEPMKLCQPDSNPEEDTVVQKSEENTTLLSEIKSCPSKSTLEEGQECEEIEIKLEDDDDIICLSDWQRPDTGGKEVSESQKGTSEIGLDKEQITDGADGPLSNTSSDPILIDSDDEEKEKVVDNDNDEIVIFDDSPISSPQPKDAADNVSISASSVTGNEKEKRPEDVALQTGSSDLNETHASGEDAASTISSTSSVSGGSSKITNRSIAALGLWTKEEVSTWLKKNKLDKICLNLSNLDGPGLQRMAFECHRDHEIFYSRVKKSLGLTMFQTLVIIRCLKSLVQVDENEIS